jgi:LmbE family N-acetylglucosaminyl deacetylase
MMTALMDRNAGLSVQRAAILILTALTVGLAACSPPDLALAGKSILIVQAHPGDEQNLAPMLADACLFQGARCHFVVAADANSPGCAMVTLARKSGPMLAPAPCANARRKEMLASAALVGGTVEFLGWDDLFYAHNRAGMRATIERWGGADGQDRLVARIMSIIGRRKPDLVFALDPRHGSSCHPGHRAVSMLLAEAVDLMPAADRPQVWLEETSDLDRGLAAKDVAVRDNGGLFAWTGNTAPVTWYDGAKALPNGWQAHRFRDLVHRIHATQDRSPGRPIAAPPPEHMRIPLVRLSDIDWREDMCTRLAIRLPTFDMPGNEARFTARMHAYGKGSAE